MPEGVEEASASEKEREMPMQSISRDWFLSELVRLVNISDSKLSVTLSVPGGILSGTLISGKAYFEAFAKDLVSSSTNTKKERKVLEKQIADYGSIYTDLLAEDASEELRIQIPQFMHLSDAKFFSPGQRPIPENGTLWRGNINAVTGFSLGAFSVSERNSA